MAKSVFTRRVFRCGASDYYADEILLANKTHSEKDLKAIADAGFNGIWLRGKLRDLAPGELFEGYSRDVEKRLAELRKLIARASRHDLGVWLYFTEPLGLHALDPFWEKRPDARGHFQPRDREGLMSPPGANALCSSTPAVKKFLKDGFYRLFKNVSLSGAILITSGEHDNNCWSNVPRDGECHCPRCAPRGAAAVIAEVITLIHDGVKSARPAAEVVAWDWDWGSRVKAPFKEIIDRLPDTVTIMGDFERGGKIERLKTERVVDEYSLIYPGPSEKFRKEVAFLKGKRPFWAKAQINVTHELATMPSMPMVVSLYRKFKYLREAGAAGFMGCWNFGCAPTALNALAVKKKSFSPRLPDEREFLTLLAKNHFGKGVDADGVAIAWRGFYRAGLSYPLNGFRFLYLSPMNFSLIYPLKTSFRFTPMSSAWNWDYDKFGDRLEDTLDGYSLEDVVTLLERLSTRWMTAAEKYAAALKNAANRENAEKERAGAVVIGCCFRSVYNTYRWYLTRKTKTDDDPISPAEKEILTDEISTIKTAIALTEKNSEFGFHGECHLVMFDPKRMRAKIASLNALVERCSS